MSAMKREAEQLQFANRADFRAWLAERGATSHGIWLVFGKTKTLKTLSASEALEEALCFGWIDGQMQSLDETKYIKYFAPRQEKSVWSDKNKAIAEALRTKGLMTEQGEAAIRQAHESGMWDAAKGPGITDEMVAALAEKIVGNEPAYANFLNMPLSVRRTYTGAYFAGKKEETRAKTLTRIIDRLNKNLKPM